MRMLRNKSKVSTNALVLVLTIAATLITVLPTVNAAVVYETTHLYLSLAPADYIGVGQQVLVVYWTALMPAPETDAEIAAGLRGAWYGVTITVTDPDDQTQTISMPRSDPIGGGYYAYTPAKTGNYSFQAHFPAQWRNITYWSRFKEIGDYHYSAADSNIASVVVQEEPREPWPETPLPTEYWTRPVDVLNREWWQAMGGALLRGSADVWPPGAAGGTTDKYSYGLGPESAHIMWTKPYWAGGIADPRLGELGFQTHHYRGLSISPIILYGKVHYTPREEAHTASGWLCVDLYTGETIFYKDERCPSMGQIYWYSSPNEHGAFPYLWRTSGVQLPEGYTTAPGLSTWEMIDGFTGEPITIVANVSARGTRVYGKDGSITYYNTVNYGTSAAPEYYLTVWNSSAMLTMTNMNPTEIETYLINKVPVTNFWQWRPASQPVHDGTYHYGGAWSLNVSTPSLLGPRNARQNQTASIRAVREREYVIVGTTGINDDDGIAPTWLMALSLERGQEGTKLWETTFTPPYKATWGAGFMAAGMSFEGVYPEDEVVLFSDRLALKWYAYDMKTGAKLWESESEHPMNYYSMYNYVYQGKLLTCGYGGELTAYNMTTGEIVWKYIAENIGFESPYGNYPINIYAMADGKIYTCTGEHSITQPMWRGPNLRCIDAETGDEIWKIIQFSADGGAHLGGISVFMGEGHTVGLNYYDNQIYCFGKGPTATTVTASPKIIANGTSVLIEGTVVDTSPGTKQLEQAMRFPNGVPAISDEYMEDWMEYVYMQQAIPALAKGVEVTLCAVDSNDNYIDIGKATSDMSGMFSHMWTPPNEGDYTIIATFEGSAGYWASYAETAVGVSEAPQEPLGKEDISEAVQAEIAEIPDYTTLDLAIIAAVVVAIVIGLVNLWALSKRK